MAARKAAEKTENTVETAVSKVKPPITFKEFAKEPVKGLMFICIVAVGYLYVDIKLSNSEDKKMMRTEIESLKSDVSTLVEHVRRSDSALSAATSKITVLQELGKIK